MDAPRQRRAFGLLIGLYLVVQVVLPLRYYLGFSARRDERFAWRMFSSTQLQKCSLRLIERVRDGERTVSRERGVEDVVFKAWAQVLERDASSVERLLEQRCAEEPDLLSAELEKSCVDADGPAPSVSTERLCPRTRRR